MRNHPLVRVAQLTAEKYQRNNIGSMAAALSYFTIFSIFPLLLVVISLVGFFIDPKAFDVQQQILSMVGSPDVRKLITGTLQQFNESRVNAGLLGVGTLLLSATGLFGALDRAFDVLWEVQTNNTGSGGLRSTVLAALFDRLVAFGMLVMCAGLILISLLANVALSLLINYTNWIPQSNLLINLGRPLITISLVAIALAVMYRVMPRQRIAWGDVWPAALIAATLLFALQALAELIFSLIDYSSYGAVGGAMALLMWIFLCGQVILIGGAISYAWAYTMGSKQSTHGLGLF